MDEPYPCELKTIGELIDRLCIVNLKIWFLVDRDRAGEHTPEVSEAIGYFNEERHDLVRAINRRLGEREIGLKVYKNETASE